jgi:hypothetical protein
MTLKDRKVVILDAAGLETLAGYHEAWSDAAARLPSHEK